MAGPHPSRDAGQTCKDCGDPPLPDGRRCEGCRALHNAREQARRAERKRKRQCRVCGEPAIKDESGERLSTCAAHREYYRSRAEAAYVAR